MTTHHPTRWERHHPAERALLCAGLLLVALRHFDPRASALVLGIVTLCALAAGISVVRWMQRLSLPMGFVALSVIPFALGHAATDSSGNVLAATSWWSTDGARHGLTLGAHALACASALLLFAATTPVHQCALLLRRLGVPSLITDAVLLTARLQAVVRERFVARQHAASLRLGDHSWSARWRTSTLLGAGLLLDTTQRAQRLERGLDLRGGFSTERVIGGGWHAVSTRRVTCVLTVLTATVVSTEWIARATT